MSSNLAFLQGGASQGDGPEVLAMLAEALSQESLSSYFTRRSGEASARLWHELLRLLLAAAPPSSCPLYFLSDLTTAAVMQQYPEDRVSWHRNTVLVRLAKIAPWGKWRALREALVALDKQKAAFLESHGPFLYLAAVGTAPAFRGCGLGSMLLDRLCRIADQQQRCVYTEATSDAARAWLKRAGFFELLRHSVRPHAPHIYVMVRRPTPPDGGGKEAVAAVRTPPTAAPVPRSRPAGSVRSQQ